MLGRLCASSNSCRACRTTAAASSGWPPATGGVTSVCFCRSPHRRRLYGKTYGCVRWVAQPAVLVATSALLFSACSEAAFTSDGADEALFAELGEARQTLASCAFASDQVPTMIGPSTPSGLVLTSGEFNGSFPAFQAFDGSRTSMWISETFETPAFIGYEFADGPRTITSYAINYVNGQITTRAPKEFTLQGFDGNGWVVVDARSNETGWSGNERREYQVSQPGSFSQYRLHVTDDNDDRAGVVVISLGDLELIGCACEVGSQVPTLTGPIGPNGAVTTSGQFSPSFPAFQAFDASATSMWISETFETPASIGYAFNDGLHTVTSYAINYVNGSIRTRAPKDFTLQGFDGSQWVVLDTRSNQTGWGGNERRVYQVQNPGAFAEYRLLVTDDNDSRAGVVVISMGRLELIGPVCE